MTTREIMEKKFDEKFCIPESYERLKDDIYSEEIKNYIFNELIPEVLEEIIPKELDDEDNYYYRRVVNTTINSIKQNAKEKFNIDL